MTTYHELLKILDVEAPKRVTLILPNPIEEIFPEKQKAAVLPSQEILLKKEYENMVAAAFDGHR